MITLDSTFVETLKAEYATAIDRANADQAIRDKREREQKAMRFTKFLRDCLRIEIPGVPDVDFDADPFADDPLDTLKTDAPDSLPRDLAILIDGLEFDYFEHGGYSLDKWICAVDPCNKCFQKIYSFPIRHRNELAEFFISPTWRTNEHECEAEPGAPKTPNPVTPLPTVEERLISCIRELVEQILAPVWDGIGIAQEAADRASEKAAKRAADLEDRLREQAQNHEYELSSVRRTAEEAKRK